jgi:hypothetical protein
MWSALIPNVDIKNMNIRINTIKLEHNLNFVKNLHTTLECKVVCHGSRSRCSCSRTCECILRPSGQHRHCLGTAFEKDVIGAVAHHGRQPLYRGLCMLWAKMVALAHAVVGCPTFIWHESIWGHNHELVVPPDHDAFVGIVTPFLSRTLLLKTVFPVWHFGYFANAFSVSFSRKRWPKRSLPTIHSHVD